MTVMHPKSTRYVPIPVAAPDATISAIAIAFVPVDQDLPDSPTWVTAELTATGAQILIGPEGGHEPGLGTWDLYLKITATPEIPWMYSGVLEIRRDIKVGG